MAVERITTLMLCNIPCALTLDQLIGIFDAYGFAASFNLVHLPSSPRQHSKPNSNLGYVFINFRTELAAIRFAVQFVGLRLDPRSSKWCTIRLAHVQGLESSLRACVGSLMMCSGGGSAVLRL